MPSNSRGACDRDHRNVEVTRSLQAGAGGSSPRTGKSFLLLGGRPVHCGRPLSSNFLSALIAPRLDRVHVSELKDNDAVGRFGAAQRSSRAFKSVDDVPAFSCATSETVVCARGALLRNSTPTSWSRCQITRHCRPRLDPLVRCSANFSGRS